MITDPRLKRIQMKVEEIKKPEAQERQSKALERLHDAQVIATSVDAMCGSLESGLQAFKAGERDQSLAAIDAGLQLRQEIIDYALEENTATTRQAKISLTGEMGRSETLRAIVIGYKN